MPLVIFLFTALMPAPVLASAGSVVEFSVPGARYKLVLDDRDWLLDEIHLFGRNGVWTRVYRGALTSVHLPEDARLEQIYGPRAKASGFLKYSDYSIQEGLGLRVKSGRNLVLLGRLGTTILDFDDEVLEAKLLSQAPPMPEGTSYIFSVKGRKRQGTFLVIRSEGTRPYRISDQFQTSLSGAATKHIFKSMARTNLRKWFKDPTTTQVLDELILLLDDRESLLHMTDTATLVRRAIRELLLREFPRLEELERDDILVKAEMKRLLDALVKLWQGREAVDGRLIRSTLITRLEAEVPERAKCELALLSLRGAGAHALSFYRSEALRAMNRLHRRLYTD